MSYDENGRKGFGILTVFILMLVAAILGGVIVLGAGHAGLLDWVGSNDSGQGSGESINGQVVQQTVTLDYNDAVVDIAERVSPAIVCINNYDEYSDFFTGSTTEYQQSSGSGVIYSEDGYIVTNNHVVEGATRIVVTLYDGTSYDATVVGTDSRTDLAVLKIDGAENLVAAEFGDSDALKVGELAIAIGNPGGDTFARSLTQGRISGLDRTITTQDGLQFTLIQTDAAINPGNSGGALLNSLGQVIGINTIKISLSGYEGMGFAIPSNTVQGIISDLQQYGKVSRPALGVGVVRDITEDLARYNNLPVDYGVLVVPNENGNAAKAGLKQYDIIIAVDGEKVTDYMELQSIIFSHNIGDTVTVTVQRGQEQLDLEIVLGELE